MRLCDACSDIYGTPNAWHDAACTSEAGADRDGGTETVGKGDGFCDGDLHYVVVVCHGGRMQAPGGRDRQCRS